MDLYEKILTKEEINKRFIIAVTAIMTNKLISSKTGLAESLGVKPAKFSEILNGRMNVGIDMIAKMCDFYGVSPDWLLLSRGNNVFRRVIKQAIWVDDENLNMEYTEGEVPNSETSEESKLGYTPNVTLISQTEESIIYKMYKEKEAKIEELLKENGRLEERIKQLLNMGTEHHSKETEVTEAFIEESSGDYGEGYSSMKRPTTSKRSSAGKV